MGDAIEINFTADSSAVDTATQKIADDLNATQDALAGVGDAGAQAGEDTGDGLSGITDASGDTADALSAVGDAGKQAGEDVTDSMADASDSAQTAGTDIVDSVGGATSTLSDIGDQAAAGLEKGLLKAVAGGATIARAVTNGVGAIFSWIAQQVSAPTVAIDALTAEIDAMYQTAASQGATFLSAAQIGAAALAIYVDPKNADKLDAATKAGSKLGLSTQTMVLALVGDQASMKQVLETAATAADKALAAQQKFIDARGRDTWTAADLGAEVDSTTAILRTYQSVSDENTKQRNLAAEGLAAQSAAAALAKQAALDAAAAQNSTLVQWEATKQALADSGKAADDLAKKVPIKIPVVVNPTMDPKALADLLKTKTIKVPVIFVDKNGKPV